MRSTQKLSIFIFALALILSLAIAPAAYGAGQLPGYQLQFLGTGAPSAINNTGVVVGARFINNSYYEPLVSSGGAAWILLPVPEGTASAFPTDVNDSGVIVGVSFNAQYVATAVRWTPSANGYTVEALPRLAGDTSSYATAINNLGQIVGSRGALGYVPTGSGWLYSDSAGLVDLVTAYNWYTAPADINDSGLMLGGTELLNLNSGLVEALPSGPANYYPITGVALNDNGQVAGNGILRSSSLTILSVFRYTAAEGWSYLAGTSRYTGANSINNLGDVGYGEIGAGVYLNNTGTYAVHDLLLPAVLTAGWTITGSGAHINDQRMIATVGRNLITNEAGGVLLTPAGTLPPPSAPVNLNGVSHPATRMEPFNSINLTWENTSPLTKSYELERRAVGETAWTLLPLTAPGTGTNHTDTSVGVNITYEYRVRAVGLGGVSEWSNVDTTTSPATPLDVTAPTVDILSPADGSTVGGTITVTAQAVDDVAVEYFEISFWDVTLSQKVILGSVYNNGSLSVNWNTSNLSPATYTLSAFAYDTLGNWTQSDIQVTVVSGKPMRVTAISLSGRTQGTRTTLTGYVTIKDALGKAVSGARVAAQWTLPDGSTRLVYANTDFQGRARFSTSGGRGTYTLTIISVTKTGYFFDTLTSILTQSITK